MRSLGTADELHRMFPLSVSTYCANRKHTAMTNERSEQDRTRDIFTHIRQILECDGDKAEILFNAIQLRMLLAYEPPTMMNKPITAKDYNWPVASIGNTLEVGKIYEHPKHGKVLITSGSFYGDNGRVSNFWCWRKVDSDGNTTGDIIGGYGTEF